MYKPLKVHAYLNQKQLFANVLQNRCSQKCRSIHRKIPVVGSLFKSYQLSRLLRGRLRIFDADPHSSAVRDLEASWCCLQNVTHFYIKSAKKLPIYITKKLSIQFFFNCNFKLSGSLDIVILWGTEFQLDLIHEKPCMFFNYFNSIRKSALFFFTVIPGQLFLMNEKATEISKNKW